MAAAKMRWLESESMAATERDAGSITAANAINTAMAGNSVCMPAASQTSGGKLANSATQAQRSSGDADSRAIAVHAHAAEMPSQSAFNAPRASPRESTATMPCRASPAQGANDQT